MDLPLLRKRYSDAFDYLILKKTLLLNLISLMGGQGYAFASLRTLSFQMGKKGEQSVKNALKSLRIKGFIDWTIGGADLGPNHYYALDFHNCGLIILSEIVHFCRRWLILNCKHQLTYDELDAALLSLVHIPKEIEYTDADPYGNLMQRLVRERKAHNPTSEFYLDVCQTITKFVEIRIGHKLDPNWEKLFENAATEEPELPNKPPSSNNVSEGDSISNPPPSRDST
jgi:hypothetical protein